MNHAKSRKKDPRQIPPVYCFLFDGIDCHVLINFRINSSRMLYSFLVVYQLGILDQEVHAHRGFWNQFEGTL